MSVLVRDRRDITLEAVYAVAWQGAGLEIAPEALELMDRCHESFEAHVADRVRAQPDALIYGVTSAPGDSAASALSPEGQAQRPSQLWTAMSFGEPLPARVVRAIVVALVAEAAGAPDEHYAPELEQLWGDEHEAAALRSMRRLLEGSARERQAHQASVSLRILPRVLGAARRAQAEAERAARVSLSSVTDNPVYLPPTPQRPIGAVYSTGGYHNAQATPAMDGLSFAQADLCQLAQRLTDHLFQQPRTAALIARDEWTLKPLHMVQNGWAENARALAHPTLLSLGGFGQNDVPALSFLSWQKAIAIGGCLDAALAVLAAVASQALHTAAHEPPVALSSFVGEIRNVFPPVVNPRPLGQECQKLSELFSREAFS